MDIDAFPEIENFQKLPRQVIVKGGSSSFDAKTGAVLTGIVINNTGQSIEKLRVGLVIFDQNSIPVLNVSTDTSPDILHQGGIGSFKFEVKEYKKEITDYYLYPNWRYDDHG